MEVFIPEIVFAALIRATIHLTCGWKRAKFVERKDSVSPSLFFLGAGTEANVKLAAVVASLSTLRTHDTR